MSLTLRPISRNEHEHFVRTRPVSFLQCASWADVRPDWTAQRLGWFNEDGGLVGVALVLLRKVPFTRRCIAYVADGPVVDWHAHPTAEWLEPLVTHLRRHGSISVRIGPATAWRRWSAATVKAAALPGRRTRLGDIPPDHIEEVADRAVNDLRHLGWRRRAYGAGFPGWPTFTFRVPLAGRDWEAVLASMNQQWRRAIRRADRAGVVVEEGSADDLVDFYRVYRATAEREGFIAWPQDYFMRIWRALNAESQGRARLYLGRHEGEVLAGMLVIAVGPLMSYAYGGSANHKRQVYPSNAVHARIIRDCIASGVEVYDMRGISDVVDVDDPEFGVARFKLGTGGEAVEQIGEWEYVLSGVLHGVVTASFTLRRWLKVRASRLGRWSMRTNGSR